MPRDKTNSPDVIATDSATEAVLMGLHRSGNVDAVLAELSPRDRKRVLAAAERDDNRRSKR